MNLDSTQRLSSCQRQLTFCLLALLSLLLPIVVFAQSDWNPATIGIGGYPSSPAWSDEFNTGSAPDSNSWVAEEIAWPYNGEEEYYTAAPSNTVMSNGTMDIIASQTSNGGRQYTSARWSTKTKMSFKQGFFAARMKLPYGQGIWPAFWLFGNGPVYSELDFVEMIGGTAAETGGPGYGNDKSYASIIWYGKETYGPIFRPGPAASHTVAPARFADEYHVFWGEWTENEVWVGFDSEQQKLADISQIAVFKNTSMYIILNLAIGGGWAGPPDSTTVFPQTLSIDWVRVWAKDSAHGPIGPVEPLPVFTSGTPSEDTPPTASSTGGDAPTDGHETTSSTGGGDDSSGNNGGNNNNNNSSSTADNGGGSDDNSSSSTGSESDTSGSFTSTLPPPSQGNNITDSSSTGQSPVGDGSSSGGSGSTGNTTDNNNSSSGSGSSGDGGATTSTGSTNTGSPTSLPDTTTSFDVGTSTRRTLCAAASATTSAFTLNGVTQPTLTLYVGKTYSFKADFTLHHFAIVTDPTADGNPAAEATAAVVLVGKAGNVVQLTPTVAGTYYYVCTLSGHFCMGNTIQVLDAAAAGAGGSTGGNSGFPTGATNQINGAEAKFQWLPMAMMITLCALVTVFVQFMIL